MVQRPRRRKLIVPVVLAVAVTTTGVAITASLPGCTDDTPRTDAGIDAPPDTPIV